MNSTFHNKCSIVAFLIDQNPLEHCNAIPAFDFNHYIVEIVGFVGLIPTLVGDRLRQQ